VQLMLCLIFTVLVAAVSESFFLVNHPKSVMNLTTLGAKVLMGDRPASKPMPGYVTD